LGELHCKDDDTTIWDFGLRREKGSARGGRWRLCRSGPAKINIIKRDERDHQDRRAIDRVGDFCRDDRHEEITVISHWEEEERGEFAIITKTLEP